MPKGPFMPLYEYQCNKCKNKIEIYTRSFNQKLEKCPKCNSDLTHVFSTFATKRQYTDTYEDILSDSNLVKGLANNNPRALNEWNKRMNGGEKIQPEFEEKLWKLGNGELP